MKSNTNPKAITLVIALALAAGSFQAYAFGTADDVDLTEYTASFKALDTGIDSTLTRPEEKTRKASSQTSFRRG